MIDRRRMLEGIVATAGTGAAIFSARTQDAVAGNAGSINPSNVTYPDLPVPERDQGMGATDASGFVAYFPLRSAGAKQVWVNSAAGSSYYNGMSPYPGYQMNGSGLNYQIGATGQGARNTAFGPKAVYADALNSVNTTPGGEGNQFFFAEGQRFVIDRINTGIMYYHGMGATYPVCFQSYDPNDPLNVTRHGRAGTGSQGARPVMEISGGVWPYNSRGDAAEYGGWVFRGLNWTAPANGQYINWAYCQNNMLFEGMVFNNVSLILQNTNVNVGFQTSSNNIVRFCSSYGQYDVNGQHICGIYSAYVNLTIEDCVFWHCGWKVGASRNAAVRAGGPDIYKHCIYLHNGEGTTSLVRRNVLIDGSAAGLSLRGNHVCHHNVIIDCPTPDFKAGGSGSDTESPQGVSQRAYCQLVIGGADISPILPRMQGFSASDGTADSYYSYCLYINNPGYGMVNNNWLAVQDSISTQISHMGFYHNRAYAFTSPDRRLYLKTSGYGSLAAIQITADADNVVSVTSPMTNAELYAAIGFSSKQAMVDTMIADPATLWAYELLSTAATAFDFNFNYTMP